MTIASHKVCNEALVQEVELQDGEVYDFMAHMKSVRPTFNRFGQHEPATVSNSSLSCGWQWLLMGNGNQDDANL